MTRCAASRCVEPAAADHGAQVVGAGPPGDAEQPGTRAGPALEAGQRPERPQVGLLGQIVGAVRVDQGGGEAPHLGLGGPDERGLGGRVAVAGGQRPLGGRVDGRLRLPLLYGSLAGAGGDRRHGPRRRSRRRRRCRAGRGSRQLRLRGGTVSSRVLRPFTWRAPRRELFRAAGRLPAHDSRPGVRALALDHGQSPSVDACDSPWAGVVGEHGRHDCRPPPPFARLAAAAGLLVTVVALLLAPATLGQRPRGAVQQQPGRLGRGAGAPAEVVLTFSEPVRKVPDKIRVIAPDGSRADRGEPTFDGHRGHHPGRPGRAERHLPGQLPGDLRRQPPGLRGYTFSVGAPLRRPRRQRGRQPGRTRWSATRSRSPSSSATPGCCCCRPGAGAGRCSGPAGCPGAARPGWPGRARACSRVHGGGVLLQVPVHHRRRLFDVTGAAGRGARQLLRRRAPGPAGPAGRRGVPAPAPDRRAGRPDRPGDPGRPRRRRRWSPGRWPGTRPPRPRRRCPWSSTPCTWAAWRSGWAGW